MRDIVAQRLAFCQTFATAYPAIASTMFLMDLQRLFTEHPQSVGETYGEHLVHASYFGGRMILAGLGGTLHALVPFPFVRPGRQAIEQLIEIVKSWDNHFDETKMFTVSLDFKATIQSRLGYRLPGSSAARRVPTALFEYFENYGLLLRSVRE